MNSNVSTPNSTGKNRFITPPLENGDHLTCEEFHRRYEAMPENVKAELIEGVVFMASPVRIEQHGEPSARVITWLGYYSAFTLGTKIAENVTVFFDSGNEYQPDAVLRIEREYGGNSFVNDDDYLQGSPELSVEVSASTISKDLFEKKTSIGAVAFWNISSGVFRMVKLTGLFWRTARIGSSKRERTESSKANASRACG